MPPTQVVPKNAPPNAVDVVCIGGGLTGMTMACLLAQAGVSVMVVDSMPLHQQSAKIYDGRASAIAHGVVPLFQHLEIWQTIVKSANPIDHISVQDCHPIGGVSIFGLHGDGLQYNHTDLGGTPFGYVVENNQLRGVLADTCETLKNTLTYHAPAQVTDIEIQSGIAVVTLSTGESIRCSLVLACDGKFSETRNRMGFKITTVDYKQHAIVCTIRHERPHNNTATEKFMPSGPFALLPMTDNRTSVVWSCLPQHSPMYMNLSDTDFHKEIAQRVGDSLGDLTLCPLRFSYPFTLIHAHDYIAHRVALVGDSAHGMHAIAGQGLNLGLRDVAVMAEIIVDALRLGRDIGALDILAEYAQWRRFDILTLETITNGLNTLFSNESSLLRAGRTLGLSLLNKTKTPKTLTMHHAMGLVGDRPRLLRGESL